MIERHVSEKYYVTDDGICGTWLEIEPIDVEVDDVTSRFDSFRRAMQGFDPRIVVRFIFRPIEFGGISGVARSEALEILKFNRNYIFVGLEMGHEIMARNLFFKRRDFSEYTTAMDKAIDLLKGASLEPKYIGGEGMHHMQPYKPKDWSMRGSLINTGYNYIGVVRLELGRAEEISGTTLEWIQRALPQKSEIRISVQRVSDHAAEITLSRRLKQSESAKSRVDSARTEALENTIVKTSLEGSSLFNIEFIVTVFGKSEHEAKQAASEAIRILGSLGQARLETFGALPSYLATFPGVAPHVRFMETSGNLPFFTPVVSSRGIEKLSASTFLFHRRGETLGAINLFATSALNANMVIVGASGRGKSALLGSLTQSLFHDPNISILKVDVGGSHSKECEILGGVERRITLNQPSGLNPFDGLPEHLDESHRSVLSNLITSLVLEEGEVALSKETRVEIDDLLKSYLSTNRPKSLTGFWKASPSFTRSKVLSRWVDGGIFGNAFRATGETNESRLTYLNMVEIFQAGDPEFAQGIMAAVLASFNVQMMNANKENRRLVLICDETPFFIQKCFPFFKFSVANVRKFGHSVILTVQNSQNLIQGSGESADTGIIDNSFHRVLMSQDGNAEDFQKRFQLAEKHMERIKELRTLPGKYSQFFYQFGDRGYEGTLRLTSEEYWQITSTQQDRKKLTDLMLAVPNLSLQEAIKCLSRPTLS